MAHFQQRARAAIANFSRRRVASVPMLVVWVAALVAVLYLSRGGVVNGAIAKGFVDPRVYTVAPVRPARLAQVNVVAGQTVDAGTVLATLDANEAEAKVVVLRASLAQARARVEAERDVVASDVARGEIWVVKARATEAADRARLKEVEAQVERLESLAGKQLVTAVGLEEARQRRASLLSKVQSYDRAIAQDPPQKAEPGRSYLEGSARTSAQSVAMRMAPFEAQVQQVEAELAAAEIEVHELTLRAPVDGVVNTVHRRAGDVVSAGVEVMTLVGPTTNEVVAWVHESLAREVRVRQGVHVGRPGSVWQKLDAHIVEISPAVEEMPQRLRAAPHIPVWGRRMVLKLDQPAELTPGEAFDVFL